MHEKIMVMYCDGNMSLKNVADHLDLKVSEVSKSLRMQGVQRRPELSAKEKNPHTKWPTEAQLQSPLSLSLHTFYMCEGWHTEKTHRLMFCNTDERLVDLFMKGMKEIYSVEEMAIAVVGASMQSCSSLLERYPIATFNKDGARNKPIVRVTISGRLLVETFIANADRIITEY